MHCAYFIKMFSSVGGGPHARAAEALKNLGLDVEVHDILSPEQWRKLCSKGKLGRLLARALTFGAFPVQVIGQSLRASLMQAMGRPTQKPIIVVTTNPFFLPHVLLATQWLHRCGVIALLYDMYPDALEAAGIEQPWVSRIMTKANRWLAAHADGVVHIGAKLRQNAESRYGINESTWIIPTGGNRNEFSAFHQSLGAELIEWMKGRCIFSYVGNMGLMHDVDTLAQAVPEFLDPMDEDMRRHVGFVIAASGPGEAKLRKIWGDRYADCIQFIGPQPDRPWADLLNKTDVSLATLTENAHATSIPSKVQSALAARCIPLVVAPEDSDIAHLVNEGIHSIWPDENPEKMACGCVVKPGDTAGLVRAMRDLCDPQIRAEYMDAVNHTAAEIDVATLAKRWMACFEKTVDDAPKPWADLVYQGIKRAFDVCAVSIGLAVIWPVLAATALAVRYHLGSPVLFKQQRPGLDGMPFELMKFRSMKTAPEGTDASHDGERLTPFGRKIRALSLDELPTLLNVLKGDMSLVGPRPLLMSYLDRYNDEQIKRQWVRPGVTGWAQVNGRNALSWEEKFALDTWYVEHASVLLDLKILFKTSATVFKRSGISHENSATMPEFMGNEP